MIDHLGIPVSDHARSKAFYAKALAPLGYTVIMEAQQDENDSPACGLGSAGKPATFASLITPFPSPLVWYSPLTIRTCRSAKPDNLPSSSGRAFATAVAAPVVEGTMFCAPPLPRRQSLASGPSTIFCVAV